MESISLGKRLNSSISNAVIIVLQCWTIDCYHANFTKLKTISLCSFPSYTLHFFNFFFFPFYNNFYLSALSSSLPMTPNCVVALTSWREGMPLRGTWTSLRGGPVRTLWVSTRPSTRYYTWVGATKWSLGSIPIQILLRVNIPGMFLWIFVFGTEEFINIKEIICKGKLGFFQPERAHTRWKPSGSYFFICTLHT